MSGGVVSNNLFAYCDNNPVNNVDPTGHIAAKPTIKGLTNHGLKRMAERSVSKNLAQQIVKNGYAISQSGGKVLYFTKAGVVVLNKSGQVVTAYSSKYFDIAMQGIIKLFFG